MRKEDFVVDVTEELVNETFHRYSAYDIALERLANEYKRVWDIADEEKRRLGEVTEETENLLITIEMEMDMLGNAV